MHSDGDSANAPSPPVMLVVTFDVSMKLKLKQIGIGIAIAIGGTLLSYGGIFLNVRFWPWIASGLLILWIVPTFIHFIIVGRVLARDRKEEHNFLYDTSQLSPFGAIAAIFGLMCAFWALPALVIYWHLNPQYPKNAIKIFALLIGIAFSTLYFLANREKFPSIADKVTFLTGVILGPVGVLEIVL